MQVTDISPASATLLAEKISCGEFVAIAGDRAPVNRALRTAPALFLGDVAHFPVGPYILAALLGCPAFLMFSIRKGGTWEIRFEPFRDAITLPRSARDQALSGMVVEFAARLEHYCRRAPLEWFNFYDFWYSPPLDVRHETR
jgi:predicted LPLAT superfamily acyltransferase